MSWCLSILRASRDGADMHSRYTAILQDQEQRSVVTCLSRLSCQLSTLEMNNGNSLLIKKERLLGATNTIIHSREFFVVTQEGFEVFSL